MGVHQREDVRCGLGTQRPSGSWRRLEWFRSGCFDCMSASVTRICASISAGLLPSELANLPQTSVLLIPSMSRKEKINRLSATMQAAREAADEKLGQVSLREARCGPGGTNGHADTLQAWTRDQGSAAEATTTLRVRRERKWARRATRAHQTGRASQGRQTRASSFGASMTPHLTSAPLQWPPEEQGQ